MKEKSMSSFAGLLVILAVSCCILFVAGEGNTGDIIVNFATGIMVLTLVLFAHAIVSLAVSEEGTAVGGYIEKYGVSSLKVSDEPGNFFVGIGGDAESLKYYFYIDDFFGHTLKSSPAEETTIVEIPNANNSRYIVRHTAYERREGNFLFGRLFTLIHQYDEVTSRILYVPEGTVIFRYD